MGNRFIIVAAASLFCSAAVADFKNGSFENGLTDWSVEYGQVNPNCTLSTFGWGQNIAGHIAPFTITAYHDYTRTIPAYCGNNMLLIWSSANKGSYATRIFQTTQLTLADLGGSCGAFRIRFKFILDFTSGEAHTDNYQEEAHFRVEVLRNNVVVESVAYTPHLAFQPPWWNPTGPYYVLEGAYDQVFHNAVVGENVTLRLTAADCCATDHAAYIYVDCVSLTPATDTLQDPVKWTNIPQVDAFIADFDGNGQADLLSWGAASNLQLAVGASFTSAGWTTPSLTGTDRGTVGDFDGDGRADLLKDALGSSIFVARSLGSAFAGSSVWANSQQTSPLITRLIYAGDFDGDGPADLLYHTFGQPMKILRSRARSTGSLSFGNAEKNWSGEAWGYGGWYIGDFNGDGKADLGRWTASGGFEVMLSTGSKFLPPKKWTGYSPGKSNFWHVGDFNCDGRDDLMRDYPGVTVNLIGTTTVPTTAEVLLSTGAGFLPPAKWYGPLTGKAHFKVGDFDGNGAADLERDVGNVYGSCQTCPCIIAADKGAPCNPHDATQHAWTFSVRNMTTKPLTSVHVSPLGGFSISPNIVTFPYPLLPGHWIDQTVTVTGATAGAYCAKLSIVDDVTGALLCSTQLCFKTDHCQCMGLSINDISCSDDGSGDFFLTFQVQNKSGSPANMVSLAGSVPGATFTPASFTVSIPSGGTSSPLTTRISGVAGIGSICLDCNLTYGTSGNFAVCAGHLCIDVPNCPGTPGWCCSPRNGCVSVPNLIACQQAGGVFSTSHAICAGCASPPWFPQNTRATVTPAGAAQVIVDDDGNLVIGQIGSTGSDGVRLDIPPVLGLTVQMQSIDPLGETSDGAWVRLNAFGAVHDSSGLAIGSVRITKGGGTFSVVPAFTEVAAPTYDIELYSGGVLIDVSVALQSSILVDLWPDGSGVEKRSYPDGALAGLVLKWDAGANVTIGGIVSSADELHIIPHNPVQAIQNVTGLSFLGANIPHIILESARVVPDNYARCLPDLNNDALVDDMDFVLFVPAYETLLCDDPAMPPGCPADFNQDGLVDDADFSIFVVQYNNLICP